MNPQTLEGLAAQHRAELLKSAATYRQCPAQVRMPRQSLRVRTGWTLVDLGLKLVAQPRHGRAAAPRPTGS